MTKVTFTIIIIAIAGLAFIAGSWFGNDHVNKSSSQTERKILYYTDPMTPGFRSEEPGIAPCGMPLEPVYADGGEEQTDTSLSPGAVKINSTRQQLFGVHVSTLASKSMQYTLRLYGKIVPDETKIYSINTSTDSWVRNLSDITTGSMVKKDQILAEVLDPDFYTAQVTYLVSLNNYEHYQEKMGEDSRSRQLDLADSQMRVAIQDILNLGITDAQVEELSRTRKAVSLLQVRSPIDGVVLNRNLTLNQWIRAGEEFYRIADLGKVWVYADVYEDEAMYLRPGMEIKINHPQMDQDFDAKVSQVLPLFDPLTKTLKVRFDVDNPRYDLRPGMFVDVEIPITMPPSLHVPADAVIDTGTTKIVYVDIGNSTFEPRRVETGWRLGRQIEITDGLLPGEKIIVAGNFLIDSESRMKTAAAGLHGPISRDPVCGMYVDEERTDMPVNKSTFAGKSYYFCMPKCKDSFEKEPEKYIPQIQLNGKDEVHAAMEMKNRSWLDMLEHPINNQDSMDVMPTPGDTTSNETHNIIIVPAPATHTDEQPAMNHVMPMAPASEEQKQPATND